LSRGPGSRRGAGGVSAQGLGSAGGSRDLGTCEVPGFGDVQVGGCRGVRAHPAALPAEEEPGGVERRGQRGGDLGQPALQRRPRRQRPVHPQDLPCGLPHPQLVPGPAPQGRAAGGGRVLERLPLHPHQVGPSGDAGWAAGSGCAAGLSPVPACPPRYTCPFVEKFSIEIETYYRPDAGQQTNVFNLSAAEKRQRILGAYGCCGAGSGRRVGPDGGIPSRVPSRGARGARHLRRARLCSLCWPLAFWGRLWGDLGRGRCLLPELSAHSLHSAAKLESALKTSWGGNFILCVFIHSPFLPGAHLSLSPSPSRAVWHGSAFPAPLRVDVATAPGSCGAFWISWGEGAGKACPHFPPPCPAFPCSPGLCSRSLSGSRPLAGGGTSLGVSPSPVGSAPAAAAPAVSIWSF